MIFRKSYKASELSLVSPAPPPDKPPLGIGDRCRMNSGSLILTVVDFKGDAITVSWRGEGGQALEASIARACLRRVATQ